MTTDAVTTRLHAIRWPSRCWRTASASRRGRSSPMTARCWWSTSTADGCCGSTTARRPWWHDPGVARTGWLPRPPRRCSWRTTVGSSGRRSTGSASRSTIRRTPTSRPASWAAGSERIDLVTGEATVLQRECDGRVLRGPNDLVVDEVGGVWFTDHGKGRRASVDRGGLYYIPPGGESGE